MHKLNFCGTLCLPKKVEGYDCRGMDIVHEFNEAVVIPMAGAATPLHVLYVSRPVQTTQAIKEILQTKDLNSKEGLEKIAQATGIAAAPDHAFDPHYGADIVFANRDKSLAYIAEKLLSKGNEKVVIWANNGIGDISSGGSDGVIKSELGIVHASMLGGNMEEFYQKGMPNSYQNSAHTHIHIAPTSKENGFDKLLFSVLTALHEKSEKATLQDYRMRVGENAGKFLPCISVCVADKNSKLDNLEFTHFTAPYSFAGVARALVTGHSNLAEGIDLTNKEVRNSYVKGAADYYGSLL